MRQLCSTSDEHDDAEARMFGAYLDSQLTFVVTTACLLVGLVVVVGLSLGFDYDSDFD